MSDKEDKAKKADTTQAYVNYSGKLDSINHLLRGKPGKIDVSKIYKDLKIDKPSPPK